MNSVSKSLDSAIHSLARVSMTLVSLLQHVDLTCPHVSIVIIRRSLNTNALKAPRETRKRLYSGMSMRLQNTIALKVNSTNRSTKLNKINAKSRRNLKMHLLVSKG